MEVVEQEAQSFELQRVPQAERHLVGLHTRVSHLLGRLGEAVGPDLGDDRHRAGDHPRLLDRLLDPLLGLDLPDRTGEGQDVDVGRHLVVRIGIGEPHRSPQPRGDLGLGAGERRHLRQRVGPAGREDRHAEREIDELAPLPRLRDLLVGEALGAQEVEELGPHGVNVHTWHTRTAWWGWRMDP